VPAALSVSSTHSANFTQGQSGAVYTVAVSNALGAGPTVGAVTVTDTVSSGLTLTSMIGAGRSCGGNSCTRNDGLLAGFSYPITVTVNVAANAASPQVNAVSVSVGGLATASATDSTTVVSDFTISLAPASATSGTVMVGGIATYTVTVAPANGGNFNGTVAPAALGMPSGFSSSFSPPTITGGSGTSTMTVTTPASGTGNLTVGANGSSGSLSHNAAPAAMAIQDYTIALSPYNVNSVPVIPSGGTQTFTISTAGINGFTGNIGLSIVSGGNGYALCNFTGLSIVPPAVAAGSAASVTMTPAPGATYCYFQVKGNAGGFAHTLNEYIEVASSATFGFTLPWTQGTLTAVPTTQAATVVFTPLLTVVSGFCGGISFQVTGLPAGVGVALSAGLAV